MGRRLGFTDIERRRLARKARVLGRKVLSGLETLVTPDTLLRWYRELVACKWDFSHRRGPGRPRIKNRWWSLFCGWRLRIHLGGYTRIRGAMANLGYQVGRGTIANILKENGIDPAPECGARIRRSTFLKAHWECLELLRDVHRPARGVPPTCGKEHPLTPENLQLDNADDGRWRCRCRQCGRERAAAFLGVKRLPKFRSIRERLIWWT